MGNVSVMNMFKLMRVFAAIAVKNVSPDTHLIILICALQCKMYRMHSFVKEKASD